jgi:valyl-tRNA synthetase
VIEPKLSTQWFLKMEEMAKPALENVMNDQVELIPSRFKNTYRHWMENIRDWCISRQLWWGHRIPAWYDASGRYAVAETAEQAADILNKGLPAMDGFYQAYDRGNISHEELENELSLRVKPEQLTQDPDVLDTWFSSWLWPIEVFKGISNPGNADHKYYYPTSDLVTGPDILFFWVARMVMAGYEYEGKKPFDHVYLTGIVRDKLGRKMSKSLGNSPDPLDLMSIYGADGVRVGILLAAPAGNDLIFDTPLEIKEDTPLESKLCEQGRNFSNKLWNAFRLIDSWKASSNLKTDGNQERAMEWMEARIQQVKMELDSLFSQFRMSEALMCVYKLIWDDFCSWFLEMMKPGLEKNISADALYRVSSLFEECLVLAHPFIPFITEELWQNLRLRNDGESILLQKITPADGSKAKSPVLDQFTLLKEGITGIRALRAEKGISFKESIQLFIKTGEKEKLESCLGIISKFLNTSEIGFISESLNGASSIRVFNTEWFVPLSAGANIEEEREKILKEIEYTEGFLKSVMAKLSNEKFVANAKGDIVEREQKKKSDAEAKLELLRNSLAALG